MNLYIIKGRVLPLRASLSFGPIRLKLATLSTTLIDVEIELTIYCNEVTIYYETETKKISLISKMSV